MTYMWGRVREVRIVKQIARDRCRCVLTDSPPALADAPLGGLSLSVNVVGLTDSSPKSTERSVSA
jgi:hypothetical protein